MKKYLKYLLFSILVLFSFYFTEKTAILVRDQDPLMQSIKEASNTTNIAAIDASIENSYIIPGLYGKRINEIKSLMNMKEQNVFNSLFLVTEKVKPNISLDDHKDKIIIKGNELKKSVSLIIENDESNVLTYLKTAKIPASLLVTKNTYNANPYFEQINNDFDNYNEVDSLLNKDNINTNICLVNTKTPNICLKKHKYLVEPSLYLGEYNIIEVKNLLTSGSIIMIKENASVSNVEVLVNYIKSKNLQIVSLSNLISEDI